MCHLPNRIPSNPKATRVTFRVQSGANWLNSGNSRCVLIGQNICYHSQGGIWFSSFLGEKDRKKKAKKRRMVQPLRGNEVALGGIEIFFWRRGKGNFF